MYKPALNLPGQLIATLALLMVLTTPTLAQEDRYRAEIVVLERLADPILSERMDRRQPERPQGDKRLWVVDENGNRRTDIEVIDNLTLNRAASQLEKSGKYRVLMKTGWEQAFPPNHIGDPLTIEVGDYLEAAGHRAVEGTIEINRRRYLLVNVSLNHWREAPGSGSQDNDNRREGDSGNGSDRDGDDIVRIEGVGTSPAADSGFRNPDRELVTWIRETRRMRSEEIHFVDSPTIGVLIYFRPLD